MNARIRAQMDISNCLALVTFKISNRLMSIPLTTGPSVVLLLQECCRAESHGNSLIGGRRSKMVVHLSIAAGTEIRNQFWRQSKRARCHDRGLRRGRNAGQEIMAQPEVVTLEGRRQPLNALVDYVSFCARGLCSKS
jgi:hypothetical protein